MEIGIVGLPGSGKTTIFNALTGSHAPTVPTGKFEPNVAVVNVPDERIDRLAEMFVPKKTVYATVHYLDIPGQAAATQGKGLNEGVLNALAPMDMLLAVLRGYEGDAGLVVNIASDVEALDLDLTISDLAKVENRMPRLEQSLRKMVGKDKERLELEKHTIDKIRGPLEEGRPIRLLDLTPEETAAIRGFAFLTQKPILYLINCDDPSKYDDASVLAPLGDRRSMAKTACAALAGQIEEEIAQLPPGDRDAFLSDYGIKEPGARRIIRLCYDLLGYISFLTAGPKEVHAWTIRRGALAPQAAGAIHSDFERGFIRAEVTPFQDLSAKGSFKACRELGLLRTEGKHYEVKDGDVVEFLFNV